MEYHEIEEYSSNTVFGIPLEFVRTEQSIPIVVEQSISFLEQHGNFFYYYNNII